ncbi:MAG: hypothetical protein ACMG57_01450 [Candidatus Dojkabacteria bacterium]
MHVEETNTNLGLQEKPHEGQQLFMEVDGVKWARFPVKTRLALIYEDLDKFVEEHAKSFYKDGDIFCLASKVVSICKGYYVKETDIHVTAFARFLVRFVKKWPHDPGFAIPQKIQLAMDIVGIPRFLFAMVGGVVMKALGKPGYFYILAGHNIGGIDGFVPEMYPEPLRGYGFLTPEHADDDAEEIEQKHGYKTAILDGNNIENIVLGMSKSLKAEMTKEKLLEIINGNPQGQSGNTPILLLRKV